MNNRVELASLYGPQACFVAVGFSKIHTDYVMAQQPFESDQNSIYFSHPALGDLWIEQKKSGNEVMIDFNDEVCDLNIQVISCDEAGNNQTKKSFIPNELEEPLSLSLKKDDCLYIEITLVDGVAKFFFYDLGTNVYMRANKVADLA